MKKFNFEKNLKHQTQAAKSTVSVFKNLEKHPATQTDKQYINPIYNNIIKQGKIFHNNYLPYGKFLKI